MKTAARAALLVIALAIAAAAPLAPTAAAQEPGRFRQGVEYRIEATFDERTDVLHGRARLRYTNNSPQALDTLYFHQHLNAFRPNSAWARRELEFGIRRFQDLGPREHAFERLTGVNVNGSAVRPIYPGAPDSTVAAIPLPTPLRPGSSAELRLDWQARLSTLPRRQGRAGRRYNWAHWYPRIAVYDHAGWQHHPLLPQGEFFGEFGSYDVTLELEQEQVLGATGVPVEGDPGWERAAVDGHGPIRYLRDVYPPAAAEPLGLLGAPPPGRKQVRWRAEEVIHFAWSTAPDHVYASADWRGIPLHFLSFPDEPDWRGVGIERTLTAFAWLEEIFGRYAYPQFTSISRVEPRGATEFPMLVMYSSVSQGIIVHEVAHQYAHAILASNEWREGWLDEGMAEFLTRWFWEEQGDTAFWHRDLASMGARERARRTMPVATPGPEFLDPDMYRAMTYNKPALVLRMLRELVGEPAMRRILRTYYDRHRLQHVGEPEFRRVVNDVTGRDLGWFFDQWLHTTDTLDYGIADARTQRLADGRWRTQVSVLRQGNAWMPVTLQVGDVRRTLDSRERRQVVEIITRVRPREAVLDPDRVLLDLDPSTHRRTIP